MERELAIGDRLHGFAVVDVHDLHGLSAVLYRLIHEKTGARLIHFANDDDNNLFSVAFRTTPMDSTGVAHILEHIVLCGSKRYPVRDPFFSMLKRSLNTFMNAFTSSDWTMYPFSTQNGKDFYNLMDVYLDAVFFPNLTETSFLQEGWRLEPADPLKPGSDLLFKGVVYNEMKGAMSDPNSLMSRRLQQALYPTTTYHFNSGGEPENIPDLSWQDLRGFHGRYYHPSNSWFFTYGNLPLKGHLGVIDDRVLSRFERIDIDTSVPAERRLERPRCEVFTYPVDPSLPEEELRRKSMVSVAWLTCPVLDHFETFSLRILSLLLLGNPAAPLYKALMDSGLGLSLAPSTGYDDEKRDTCFAAGLQGVDYRNAGKVEDVVLSTLERTAREGFTRERVEAVLHQVEFEYKEVAGDRFPYGLRVLFRIFGAWIHDGDPLSPLLIDENLERLRKELEKGRYFENRIYDHFLHNSHRVTVILKPDPAMASREAAREAERLAVLKARLSREEMKRLLEKAEKLRKEQESNEDLSCLPTLELKDIPRSERLVECEKESEAGVPLQWYDQGTNGIGYFNTVVSADVVPENLRSYIPLFCNLLTKIGAAGHDYTEMAERMEACTGGIIASPNVWEDVYDLNRCSGVVELSAKALVRNNAKMLEILSDIFMAPDFRDLKRLRTVIGQIKTSMENSIPASGHGYAKRLAARYLTPAAKIREEWFGVHQLRVVRKLASGTDKELALFASKMEEIASCLLNRIGMHGCVVAERRNFPSMRDDIHSFLENIPGRDLPATQREGFTAGRGTEGWSANVPVSYVAQVFRTVPYTHEDSPKLQVLASLLRSCYIHREVREKGGAYGGYATFSASEGLFAFLSYRDPHLERTLKVYRDAVQWLIRGDFTEEDIKEAILSTFADIDRPLSPAGRGNREFICTLRGITREMRMKRREAILGVDRGSLIDAAVTYLRDNENCSVAAVSGEETLKEASSSLGLSVSRI